MKQRGRLGVARMGVVDYPAALKTQEALVRARQQDRISDLLLLLEHPHVFTLGRGANEKYLLNPNSVPVYRVSRGGEVTYHGPGQLVGYPIVKLEGAARDVADYLRRLEQTLIESLRECQVDAGRRAGLTGVWVGNRKIGSIGVGIRRWVTLHGFALNVCCDLRYFDSIVPCGIEGCVMTSIAAEGRPHIAVADFAEKVAGHFARIFGHQALEPVDSHALYALIDRRKADCEAQIRYGSGAQTSRLD